MKAELLLLITQIGGIYRDINDPKSLVTDITPKEAVSLIEQGIIKDGMIPKVEEAISLLEFGIKSIAIAAARRENVFKALAESGIQSTPIKATRIHNNI